MRPRERLAKLRDVIASERWAVVPLRLLIGYGFAVHGYAKLVRGPAAFADILTAMGVPAPVPMAWLTALLELVGGLSVMVGAAVATVSIPLMVVMATAMFGVHLRYGFSSIRLKSLSPAGAEFGPIGYELNLLYIAALAALALTGASPLSVDKWIGDRRRARGAQRESS
jgi:putative oxidoreductase